MIQLSNRSAAFFLITHIFLFSGCVSTPEQEKIGNEQSNDIDITTKVHTLIVDEPSLRRYDINIRSTKGIVELSGFVNSRDDINKALAIARSVSGVKSIRNDLRIHPGGGDY